MLHAIALAAFFGHLNRIADAVDVPLDYRVRRDPPRAEPAIPPFLPAPAPVAGPAALELGRRGPTAAALAAWMEHVARRDPGARWRPAGDDRDARRPPARRCDIGEAAPRTDLDRALLELADRITLAPWQLEAASYAALRAAGLDDRALFDACVVASSAGVSSRIEVALAALGRDPATEAPR